MVKKMSAMILALTILCGCLNSVLFDKVIAADETEFDSLAYALHIVDRGNDKFMTRGETASIAVRMLGLFQTAYDEDLVFEDVSEGDANAGAISTAYELGLIGGASDTTFEPEEYVTYEQVAKIFVNLLGYREEAESAGGYPGGYLLIAKSLGIGHNVSLNNTDRVARANMAMMVANALEIKVVHPQPNADEYTILYGENETLAKSVFGLEKYTGTVTAAYGKKLTPYSVDLLENQVHINDALYIDENGKAAEFLGYEIAFYAKTGKNGQKTVVYAEKRNARVLEIAPEFIKDFQSDRNHIALEYYKSADTSRTSKTEFYYDTTKLVYNGVYTDITRNAEDLFDFTEGSIKAVDKDEDGIWDFLFIDRYVTAVVKSYDGERRNVHLEYPVTFYDASVKSIALDEFRFIEYDDMSQEGFAKGDVIQLYPSRVDVFSEKYLRIKRSTEKVTGKLTGKNERDGKKVLVINEAEYSFSNDYVGYNRTIYNDLKLGERYTFYLNSAGNIAYVENGITANRVYGYLTGVKVVENFSTKEVTVRTYTQEGYFYDFPLADKVRVYKDGEDKGRMSAYDAVKHLLIHDTFDPTKAQLIRFLPDRENVITLIEFAENDIADPSNERYLTNNLFVKSRTKYETMWYRMSKITYKDDVAEFPLPQDAVYFTVPTNVNSLNNEFAFAVGSCPYGDDRTYITVDTYCDDEMGIPQVIVNYGTPSYFGLSGTTKYVVVDEIEESLNEEGESVFTLVDAEGNRYSSLESKTFCDPYDGTFYGPGDVIQIGNEHQGYVKVSQPIFAVDFNSHNGIGYAYSNPSGGVRQTEDSIVANGVYHSTRQIVSGFVSNVKSGYLELTNAAGNEKMVFYLNTTKVNTVYPERGNFQIDTTDNLNIGDFVVLRLYVSMTQQIVRYVK